MVERVRMDLRIPTLRIELDGVKHAMIQALLNTNDEMIALVQKGIGLAYEKLPILIIEKVQAAMSQALEEAISTATKAYFSPGGEGYEQIIREVAAQYQSQRGERV